jgi:hypothetical protein
VRVLHFLLYIIQPASCFHFVGITQKVTFVSSSSFVALHCSFEASTLNDRPKPRTSAILRCISRINALVVLTRMVLDLLPHLLDGAVERLVRLVLRVDEVVRVVCGLVGGATRLRGWGRGGGVDGGGGGGEGEDAGVRVHVVHFEGWLVG